MRCALLVLAALFLVGLIKIPLAEDVSRYNRSLEDERCNTYITLLTVTLGYLKNLHIPSCCSGIQQSCYYF